jgi:hypothetical protein
VSTPGTTDRPSAYGSIKQDPMNHPAVGIPPVVSPRRLAYRRNRTREMQLLSETLSRARMQDRLCEAESARTARRLLAARRMQRRAERASRRARRALAVAVM